MILLGYLYPYKILNAKLSLRKSYLKFFSTKHKKNKNKKKEEEKCMFTFLGRGRKFKPSTLKACSFPHIYMLLTILNYFFSFERTIFNY
jgi:hypothetical protein